MKTIAKVLEVMLTKPATATWTAEHLITAPAPGTSSAVPGFGPTSHWSWGG